MVKLAWIKDAGRFFPFRIWHPFVKLICEIGFAFRDPEKDGQGFRVFEDGVAAGQKSQSLLLVPAHKRASTPKNNTLATFARDQVVQLFGLAAKLGTAIQDRANKSNF
jgi:hypothetical protein